MNPFSSAPLGLAGRILYAGENPSGKSLDRNIPDDRFGLSAFRKSEPGSGSDRSRLFYDQMVFPGLSGGRSEEHTSELQSLMRISYAVFCLKKIRTQYQYQTKYST